MVDEREPASGDPHRRERRTAEELLPADELVQLLDADGVRHEHPRYTAEVGDDALRELYRWMNVVRAVDRESIHLQRQGQLGVYASGLGQEAAQVGSASALADADWVFPSYRELGVGMVRGVDPVRLLHLNRGTWLADHDPHEHGFAPPSIPIGTQALHAVGFALGALFDGAPIVAVTYLGDGATSEGDTHEALTFAGVMGAPVVFFVQNNQYAISVPVEEQTAAPTLAHKGVGYGIPAVRVDGNDVLGTYAVTREAVDRARAGEGPTLIEAVTYRREAHTTSDDADRYRPREEVEAAEARDPILRMARYLRANDLLDDAAEREVQDAAARLAGEVRARLYDAPHGDPRELFSHVYVDPTGHFEEQAALLERELGERGQAPR